MSIIDIKDIKTQSEPELITTSDGSHSLYIKDLDEPYHSFHGALQESKHVFIDAGLNQLLHKNLKHFSILEIGLGTGLNTLLSINEAKKYSSTIHSTCIEAFPISNTLANKLNYVQLLNGDEEFKLIFEAIHECPWEKDVQLTNHFTIHKTKQTFQEVQFNSTFDLIYFDAFGPPTQPELWTEEIFQKIYNATNPEGILVTYCAKGIVKRTLIKVGFEIETLPGPPRKREMIRATKLKNK